MNELEPVSGGDLTEAIQGIRDAEPTHEYLSTACYHGFHDRCRLTCKFCSTPCRCVCHMPGATI